MMNSTAKRKDQTGQEWAVALHNICTTKQLQQKIENYSKRLSCSNYMNEFLIRLNKWHVGDKKMSASM